MRENIIVPAWDSVIHATSIKKFNFFPAFLGILWLSMIILYQITFTYVQVFHKKDEFFSVLDRFIHATYFTETITGVILIFLCYIFISPIAEAGVIQMIHHEKENTIPNHKSLSWISGFFRWCAYFLPIFELQNMLSIFRLISVITFYILLLRIFWKEYFLSISVIMGIYLLFSFCLNMFFAYAPFFIIFENKKAFEALALSTQMAIHNIEVTSHLYFTLLLVYLRTIIIAIIFIILPFIISWVLAFITTISIKIVFLIFAWISIGWFLLFVSHLNSVLEIFMHSIWYHAYIENKKLGFIHTWTQNDTSEKHDDHHHSGG